MTYEETGRRLVRIVEFVANGEIAAMGVARDISRELWLVMEVGIENIGHIVSMSDEYVARVDDLTIEQLVTERLRARRAAQEMT